MSPEAHALLSASSSGRWMNCPGSVHLTKDMADQTSGYAEAGRLAHSIGELKLRKRFIAGMGPKKYQAALDQLTASEHFDPEMHQTTDQYVEFVELQYMSYPERPYMVVEQKVDFSSFVPEGFGTADCILIGNGTMDIIDYKHGKGVPVDAEDNPQMKLYALGAIMHYKDWYEIGTVRMHIVQPRVGDPLSFEMSRDQLIEWGTFTVRPIAKEAFDGSETFKAGAWCSSYFCKARYTCKHRSETYTTLEDFGCQSPHLLTNDEIGGILVVAGNLKKWASDLEEYSLAAILRGENIPGWKAVAGRSVRAFDNTDAAFNDLLESGIEYDMLYERKPLTLAAIEKMLGKKRFAEIAGNHIVTPLGKPALAPETDKRPPYNTAEEDFKEAANG